MGVKRMKCILAGGGCIARGGLGEFCWGGGQSICMGFERTLQIIWGESFFGGREWEKKI